MDACSIHSLTHSHTPGLFLALTHVFVLTISTMTASRCSASSCCRVSNGPMQHMWPASLPTVASPSHHTRVREPRHDDLERSLFFSLIVFAFCLLPFSSINLLVRAKVMMKSVSRHLRSWEKSQLIMWTSFSLAVLFAPNPIAPDIHCVAEFKH